MLNSWTGAWHIKGLKILVVVMKSNILHFEMLFNHFQPNFTHSAPGTVLSTFHVLICLTL